MTSPMALKKAEQIKHIAAEMVQSRIKDPRLGFVTITDVRLSKDGREATLFYTVMGGEPEAADTAAALDAAKGQIRTTVSKRLGMRFAPTISFVHDAMPESSAHFEQLLAGALAGDAEVASKAAAAEYAGEADPYRKKDDLTDADEAAGEPGQPAPVGQVDDAQRDGHADSATEESGE